MKPHKQEPVDHVITAPQPKQCRPSASDLAATNHEPFVDAKDALTMFHGADVGAMAKKEPMQGQVFRFIWNYVTDDEVADLLRVLRRLAVFSGTCRYFNTGLYLTDRTTVCAAVELTGPGGESSDSYLQQPDQVLIFVSNIGDIEANELEPECRASPRYLGSKRIASEMDAHALRDSLPHCLQLVDAVRANIISDSQYYGSDAENLISVFSEDLLFQSGFEAVGYDLDFSDYLDPSYRIHKLNLPFEHLGLSEAIDCGLVSPFTTLTHESGADDSSPHLPPLRIREIK